MVKAPITVKEARKILGNDSKYMNDTQIKAWIEFLQITARRYLAYNGSDKA